MSTHVEFTVPANGAQAEVNEKPSSAETNTTDITGTDEGDATSANETREASSSSEFLKVNMAGIVTTNGSSRDCSRDFSDHSSGMSDVSDDRYSKPKSLPSLKSQVSNTSSVWESDFNDMDNTSFGEEDDDDFYGLKYQNNADRLAEQGEFNNPHIQQTYAIPKNPLPLPPPLPPSSGSSMTSDPQEQQKARPKNPSGSGAPRRSRRGSMRVPGDIDSDMKETEDERRKREFQERLNKLERQQSRNRLRPQPKREPFKCTKDLIPVTGSLLLLAVGIAVAIYLLFGNNEEAATVIPAPTLSPTVRDPTPFRRNLVYDAVPIRRTDEECEAVQNGRPILGQDLMASIEANATMDITTYEDIVEPTSILLKEIRHYVERRMIPALVGCLDKEEENSDGRVDTISSKLRRNVPRIQKETNRIMIMNGKVLGITLGPATSCYGKRAMFGPCYRLVIGFQFWHSGRPFLRNDALLDELFNEPTVDKLFTDMTTTRRSTGDIIISQARMIRVAER